LGLGENYENFQNKTSQITSRSIRILGSFASRFLFGDPRKAQVVHDKTQRIHKTRWTAGIKWAAVPALGRSRPLDEHDSWYQCHKLPSPNITRNTMIYPLDLP
jgi:hypothetical protein